MQASASQDSKPDHAPIKGQGSGGLPGDEGVWFFIIADMGMFAVFFLLFMFGQAQDPETYRQSRSVLDPLIGLLNTIILLFSGWWIVRAVEAARREEWEAAFRRTLLALIIGLGFAVTKILEYKAKYDAGIAIDANEFFTYYFAFTGIHFLHFVIGVGVLIVTLTKLRKPEGGATLRWLESAAAYWHMVDLLWLILFPMIYLAGGTA